MVSRRQWFDRQFALGIPVEAFPTTPARTSGRRRQRVRSECRRTDQAPNEPVHRSTSATCRASPSMAASTLAAGASELPPAISKYWPHDEPAAVAGVDTSVVVLGGTPSDRFAPRRTPRSWPTSCRRASRVHRVSLTVSDARGPAPPAEPTSAVDVMAFFAAEDRAARQVFDHLARRSDRSVFFERTP